MKRKYLYIGTSAFLIAAILGAYTYFSFLLPYYVYQSAEKATQMYMKALQSREAVLLTTNPFLYGKVLEVHPPESYVVVDIENPYQAGAHVRIRVDFIPGSFIARQALTQDADGAYVALSQKVPASLSDVRPGDRAAFTINASSGQSTSAYFLFGNPL